MLFRSTIKRDIESDIPLEFVKRVNIQKSYIDFINGHRLLFRPYDDEGKLRSLNVSMFIIVEASEVNAGIFSQLKTRLRNMNAAIPDLDENGIQKRDSKGRPIYKHDWRKGIIETNPDAGWVRSDVLLAADKINKHGHVQDEYLQNDTLVDPRIAIHIAATDCNVYLPVDFVAENTHGKPDWWVARFIYGSFNYAEGMVYPKVMNCVCEPIEIPPHWKRMVAFDYGLNDDSVYVLGAIDEEKGLLYIYKEARTTQSNVEELARLFFKSTEDIPYGMLYKQPIIDPKSGPKRDYQKRTLSDHFLEYGIAFMPGQVSKVARILRTNTYMETGRLRIFNDCVALIEELKEYKYEPSELGKPASGKPVDKNDHGISALEWIVMELPADPKMLYGGAYDESGTRWLKPMRTLDRQRENYNPILPGQFDYDEDDTSPLWDAY